VSKESVICPKCGLKSYLPGDIESRYCGKCGYHDSLHNTTPGVPGVSAKFRQPTPLMQLQATLSALEGNYYCWSEGLTPEARFRLITDRLFADIRELQPHLNNGAWLKPEAH
jgi:ribosomal protein S27AE